MTMRHAAPAILLFCLGACSGGGPAPNPCEPSVEGIVWEGMADPAVSRQMKALAEADGADRSTPGITLATLLANDEARRVEVLSYLQGGKVTAPADLFHAATIFARGTCPEHLELSLRLARRSWERGAAEAWNLYVQSGVRWMEMQGKKPRVEEGRLRAWPVLEDLDQRLWSKGDGTFAVPMKLPSTLEPKREELEAAVLAAQAFLRNAFKDFGWEKYFEEGFIDRVAVFETKNEFDRVVNQLRETAPTDPVDPFLAGLLEYRALVVLSPGASAELHPAFAGEQSWEKLLVMALARQLHRRVAGSESAMGPAWFREGFAARTACLPPKRWNDSEMERIMDGRAPLDPQACANLFMNLSAGSIPQALELPKKGPVIADPKARVIGRP